MLKRITVRGSLVGSRADMREALTLASSFDIKAHIELQPLEQINDVFDRLRHGKVQGRVVLDLRAAAATERLAS